jgi:hypothetical protein
MRHCSASRINAFQMLTKSAVCVRQYLPRAMHLSSLYEV